MCMKDNICNNSVLSALHNEAYLSYICHVHPGGLVRQVEWVHPCPELAMKPPKFSVQFVLLDHSGHAWGGGANKSTGVM